MKRTMKSLILKTLCVTAALIFAACSAACSAKDRTVLKDEYPHHCTLYIDCRTVLDNRDKLDPDKEELIPEDGVILAKVTVGFEEGDSVYDILIRELHSRRIHVESTFVEAYNAAYVEGIANIYEFDCGWSSGWEYCVNGVFPNYGCSAYYPEEGDEIMFLYTCDLGKDISDTYYGH